MCQGCNKCRAHAQQMPQQVPVGCHADAIMASAPDFAPSFKGHPVVPEAWVFTLNLIIFEGSWGGGGGGASKAWKTKLVVGFEGESTKKCHGSGGSRVAGKYGEWGEGSALVLGPAELQGLEEDEEDKAGRDTESRTGRHSEKKSAGHAGMEESLIAAGDSNRADQNTGVFVDVVDVACFYLHPSQVVSGVTFIRLCSRVGPVREAMWDLDATGDAKFQVMYEFDQKKGAV
ncbi:hypothetical protein B0H19DRAFT_1080355 [Mycena capillaripes]|nr:hypothetical protein B0H19DRAFT_1080355 [Mycena capillaripes]